MFWPVDKIKRELHDFYEISTSTRNACYQKHITWWHCVPYTLNIYKHVLNVWILKNSQECNMTINLVRCCSVRNVFQRISWQTTLPKFYSSPCTSWLETKWPNGYCSGLQVERTWFKTWPSHCVVFLGKAICTHSVYLRPGVYMDTRNVSGYLIKC